MRSLGWRPDPPKAAGEKRDYEAAEILTSEVVPEASDNRGLVRSILDQGGISSCVAQAVMQAVRASHVRQGLIDAPLGSRLFAYYLSRSYHHDTGGDTGTFLRTCFGALNKFGFCVEDAWPYVDDGQTFRRMPSTEAFRVAFDQKSPTVYRRINSEGRERVDDVKRALAAGYLVSFGTGVSFDFTANKLSEPLDPPNASDVAGGHAMCFVGHTGDVFDTVNSWGTDWGDRGYCRFGASYVAWAGTQDLWLCEHAPRFS